MATNDELMKEIMLSRKMNDEQHEKIFESAEVSMKLAEDINGIVIDFSGFRKTILAVSKFIMVIGALYLIFKDQLHAIFGG